MNRTCLQQAGMSSVKTTRNAFAAPGSWDLLMQMGVLQQRVALLAVDLGTACDAGQDPSTHK